jgi:hypothetical protein
MSLVEDLGAQVRAGTDELPVANVTAGLARLRAGLDLLRWARQESTHDIGGDRLAVAAEHLENAGRALLVAQDHLATYLTAIGLTRDGNPAPPSGSRGDAGTDGGGGKGRSSSEGAGTGLLGDWWSDRVAVLTDTEPAQPTGAGSGGSGTARSGPAEPEELLTRVADRVRAGDRRGLASALGSVKAHVGLAVAAVAPVHAHEAATQLLGRPPAAADLPRLTALTRSRITELLPGLPDEAVEAQLARVCRAPMRPSDTPLHPADSAVAGAVLAGVLAHEAGASRGRDNRHDQPREPGVHA